MTTLASLVQALPAELYNEIYDLTFTADPGNRYIDGNYKPPSCLQVSRSTRKTFEQSYYGNNSIFYGGWKYASKWTWCLPRPLRFELLEEVEITKVLGRDWVIEPPSSDEIREALEKLSPDFEDDSLPSHSMLKKFRIWPWSQDEKR